MIVDVNQEFRLKMLKMMKFDEKYARCNGIAVLNEQFLLYPAKE